MDREGEITGPTTAQGRVGVFGLAWTSVPGWVFRAAGATLFIGFVVARIPVYLDDFRRSGAFFVTPDGQTWYVPWGRLLIDITYLLIGLAFIFRAPPKEVASRPRDIVIPLIAAFWPMFPFWVEGALTALARPGIGLVSPETVNRYGGFMFDYSSWTPVRFLLGTGLIIVGNAIDVWSYATLFRSISIVAEARELKTSGPYRFVRHPVYLGQFVAQAGVWLVLVNTHVFWMGFYLCFVAMQLFRSRIEEDVLERHFGEAYRAYRRRVVWFWR